MSRYKSALPKLPERGYFIKGDKGEEVKKMQRAVNWANNGSIVAPLKIDGIVGNLTIGAVSFMEEVHHLAIDGHFGIKCRNMIANLNLTGAIKACNWAVSVSKDNRFSYGSGMRAHRCGCYFCGTNTGPKKKNKERKGEPHVVKDSKGNGHTYEMTYCCNTFATAAYAHGAKDPTILKLCRNCNCAGLYPEDGWLKKPTLFEVVGKASKVDFSKLKAGDVILNRGSKAIGGHAWIYLGADKFVEATSIDGKDKAWSADAIRTRSGAKRKYNNYVKKDTSTTVVRYTK